MKKITLNILLIIFSLHLGFAQSFDTTGKKDKEKMKGLLESETSSLNSKKDSSENILISIFPERLPQWVNNIKFEDKNKIYLLGISEPDMEETEAEKMAMNRILTLSSLLLDVSIGNMRDYFVLEDKGVNTEYFLDYTRFIGSIYIDTNKIEIEKKYRTKFKETILLAAIDKSAFLSPAKKIKIYSKADIISKAMMVRSKSDLIIRTEIDTKIDEAESEQYFSLAINRITNTEASRNGKLISELPALRLNYSIEEAENNDFENIMGYRLDNGLWYAYITAIFFELADKSHGNPVHFSNLSDIFNNNIRNLNRELVLSKMSCVNKQILIKDNQLFLKCL